MAHFAHAVHQERHFISCYLVSTIHCNDLRQRYFSDLGLPLTVETLLKGQPDESVSVNNLIFKRVQLYILARDDLHRLLTNTK